LLIYFISACELPCVTNPNLGGCKAGDNTCLCNNDVFVQSTFQCIQAACTGQDLHDAIAGAAALCAAVVCLPLPFQNEIILLTPLSSMSL
jgi:hypothetical protein